MPEEISELYKELIEIIKVQNPKLLDDFLKSVEKKYGKLTPEILDNEIGNALIGYLAEKNYKNFPEIYGEMKKNNEI